MAGRIRVLTLVAAAWTATARAGGTDEEADGDVPPDDDGAGEDGDTETGPPCLTDDDCLDDLYCKGEEECIDHVCVAGTDPCVDDFDCTTVTCNEEGRRCEVSGNHALCQDGVFCNGEEICSRDGGCVAGVPRDCSDTSECPIDTCDEAAGECVHGPLDPDADTYMTSTPPCDAEGGTDCADDDPAIHPGAPAICDDGLDNDCDRTVDLEDPDCRLANDTWNVGHPTPFRFGPGYRPPLPPREVAPRVLIPAHVPWYPEDGHRKTS